MKTRITKKTWERLIVIGAYQEFLKEWLNLYDAYMAVNPPIEKELQIKCFDALLKGLQDKRDKLIKNE